VLGIAETIGIGHISCHRSYSQAPLYGVIFYAAALQHPSSILRLILQEPEQL
jgi:hypothetical protein